jgi:hypothetical protein
VIFSVMQCRKPEKPLRCNETGKNCTVQLRETGAGLSKQSLAAFSTKSSRRAPEAILSKAVVVHHSQVRQVVCVPLLGIPRVGVEA